MAFTPAGIIGITAGVTFIVVSIALLALRPPRSGIQGFAAYAGLVGVGLIFVYLGSQGPAWPLLLSLATPLLAVAGLFLVSGALRYSGYRAVGPLVPFAALVVAGAVMIFVAPDVMYLASGTVNDWGIVLWQMPFFVGTAFSAWLIERRRREAPSPELRLEATLLLTALVPHLGYTSAVSLSVALLTPGALTEVWGVAYLVGFGSAILGTLLIVGSLVRDASRGTRALAVFCVGVTLAGAVQYLLVREFVVFGGALRILGALLLGYGLLKYGLFDVDLGLKWTLDRGALVAIFGSVFFIIEQTAEYYVSDTFGTLAGFVAAGALLFLLKPLRRTTGRLAARVFPRVAGVLDEPETRGVVVYRTAALAAARDGVITAKERAMLEALVRELRIPETQVATVEREIASAIPA